MSISISEFKTWAGQNRNAAVAVVDGALADASNQIGVVGRLFKRGTVNGVRSAVMVECKFLSALIARGEPIPEPGARLTEEQKGLFRELRSRAAISSSRS